MLPRRLATERLVLRPYCEEDRAAFVALFCDPEIMRHVGGAQDAAGANQMFEEIRTGRRPRVLAAWIVEDGAGDAVGHAVLLTRGDAVEIGYLLCRERWGCGFATEIARALIAEARAHHRGTAVVAIVNFDNVASQRVVEKAGLVKTGQGRDEQGLHHIYELASRDALPDARDGLTRLERIILVELSRLEAERGGAMVPTAMLYGRVVEHVNVSVAEFQRTLARLVSSPR